MNTARGCIGIDVGGSKIHVGVVSLTDLEIVRSRLGSEAGVIGAATWAQEELGSATGS